MCVRVSDLGGVGESLGVHTVLAENQTLDS